MSKVLNVRINSIFCLYYSLSSELRHPGAITPMQGSQSSAMSTELRNYQQSNHRCLCVTTPWKNTLSTMNWSGCTLVNYRSGWKSRGSGITPKPDTNHSWRWSRSRCKQNLTEQLKRHYWAYMICFSTQGTAARKQSKMYSSFCFFTFITYRTIGSGPSLSVSNQKQT